MRHSSATRGIPVFAAITLAALLILLTGCPPDDPTQPETDPEMAPPPEVVDPIPPPDPRDVVVVSLTDFQITMPGTVSDGSKTFQIANEGDAPHSFVIEGEGVDERLPEELQPGESAILSVELEPGTYRVFCPVGDHAERGMEAQLTVR